MSRIHDEEYDRLTSSERDEWQSTADSVESGNSWLEPAGIFKEDPFADELQASIAAYRRELDAINDPL